MPVLSGRKVAHITTIDTSLDNLLRAQLVGAMDQGAEVLGISAPGRFVERIEGYGVRHIALSHSTRGPSLGKDLLAALELYRILRRERPFVFHTHNPKPGVYGRIIGRMARVPVVVNTIHGLYATPEDPLRRRFAVYLTEWIAARCSDAELVQNEEDVRTVLRLRIAPTRKVRHLGNGIDIDHFSLDAVAEGTADRLRRELGIADDAVVVGVVSRLEGAKGIRVLFDAARSLGPGLRVIVAGEPDPSKPDVITEREIEEAKAHGVIVLGHRDDVRDLYAVMDIVALPSYREGMPRTLMEGAAMSRPLIATDVRGCRQVVVDGVNGRLVPAGDADALRRAILELSGSHELRRRYGEASRQRAVERFDERDVVERVLSVYAEVAARKGRGSA